MEIILEGVRERGFELIPFEDHIAFRYAYESKSRSRWDRGEDTDLVVVLYPQCAISVRCLTTFFRQAVSSPSTSGTSSRTSAIRS